MKCNYCRQDMKTKEVRTIEFIFCCNEIQIEHSSLRPNVQKTILERDHFFQELSRIIYTSETSTA